MVRNLLNFNVRNNLFSFFIGSNDFWIGLAGQQLTDEHVDNIVAEVIKNIGNLINFGGKHFLVFGPANLGLMPIVAKQGIAWML